MPKLTKTDEQTKKGNRPGYIAGTNFPVRVPHNEKGGVFHLEQRRKRVLARYVQGWSQWEIAREEKVDQSVIYDDLVVIKKKYDDYIIKTLGEHKKTELAKIDGIEEQMWIAWYKSCEVERVVTVEHTTDKEGATTDKKRVVKKKLIGDTRYIERIQWCIDQRCKILGITKDKQVTNNNLIAIPWDQIVGSTGGDAINNELAKLEQLPDHVSIDGETSEPDTKNVGE